MAKKLDFERRDMVGRETIKSFILEITLIILTTRGIDEKFFFI